MMLFMMLEKRVCVTKMSNLITKSDLGLLIISFLMGYIISKISDGWETVFLILVYTMGVLWLKWGIND